MPAPDFAPLPTIATPPATAAPIPVSNFVALRAFFIIFTTLGVMRIMPRAIRGPITFAVPMFPIRGGTKLAPGVAKMSLKITASMSKAIVAGKASKLAIISFSHPPKLIELPGTIPPIIQKGAKATSNNI